MSRISPSLYSELFKTKLFRFYKTFDKNKLFQTERCFSSKQFSFELFPDVEELLDSGSMKHRKHPGVRKIAPIKIPPVLADSVDRLLSKEGEKKTKKDAVELLASLTNRRLPLEREEIDMKIKNMYLQSGDDEEMPEVLTKEQIYQLRREIRSQLGRWKPILYNYQEGLAYLVARLDANYASIWRVFNEIKSSIPSFQPKTFFDFGCGVGSAIWAARDQWGENIKEYFCVDSSPDMIQIAQDLLTDEVTEEALFKTLYFRQFLPASSSTKFDLVVSAFSMLDLPSLEDRLRVVDTLWRKTSDILVIIEYGNFAGFFSVMDARDYILQIENQSSEEKSPGAHIVSPCPHEYSCPMLEAGTKRACGIHVTYETSFPRERHVIKKDWISYVVLRKGPKTPEILNWPRIVKPVLKKSGHAYCRACCSDGKINEVIVTKSKHGRNAYRCTRSSNLGDMLPVNIQPSTKCTSSSKKQKEDKK